MTDIFLNLPHAWAGDLPDVCMICGASSQCKVKSKLFRVTFATPQGLMQTKPPAKIPLCRKHSSYYSSLAFQRAVYLATPFVLMFAPFLLMGILEQSGTGVRADIALLLVPVAIVLGVMRINRVGAWYDNKLAIPHGFIESHGKIPEWIGVRRVAEKFVEACQQYGAGIVRPGTRAPLATKTTNAVA